MTGVSTRKSWDSLAACRGPYAALFFPPRVGESSRQRYLREFDAKRICLQCRVRQECLQYALRSEERFGIWGGLNETERRDLSEVTTP